MKPASEKDECCPCPKCGSEITRFVARDSGKSWINKHAKKEDRIGDVVIWRCLDCGNVYTVDNNIKCCDEVNHEVRQSRGAILSLDDDWDGKGSKKIDKSTFDRAVDSMRIIINAVKKHDIDIGPACMFPGHEGEIELLWKDDDFTLSIDIPENPDGPIVYFGTDDATLKIKGKISFDPLVTMLVTWIKDVTANASKMTPWKPLDTLMDERMLRSKPRMGKSFIGWSLSEKLEGEKKNNEGQN
jgi:hypothetical protein